LLPVLEQETGSKEAAVASAIESLSAFEAQFEAAHNAGLRRLLKNCWSACPPMRADFTLTFRRLCDAAEGLEGDAGVRALFTDPDEFDSWASIWRRRLNEEPHSAQERAAAMRAANPACIPRNHLVEAALDAAVRRQDFQPVEELLDVVSRPYEDRPNLERYATPARPEERVCQTFCGT
jgi:serine/tyrosine/threonine adenylyltransferase